MPNLSMFAASLAGVMCLFISIRSHASPPSKKNAFHRWLLSDRKVFPQKLPDFGSGICGGIRLSKSAATALIKAQIHPKRWYWMLADFQKKYNIPTTTAFRIYAGFYYSLLVSRYGFRIVNVSFQRGGNLGSQPVVRGLVPSADKRFQFQVSWRKGVFHKERRLGVLNEIPRYFRKVLPSSYLPHVPGQVEGLLLLHKSRYRLWVRGRPITDAFAAARFPGAIDKRQVFVNSTKPCRFTDSRGRSSAGSIYDSYRVWTVTRGPQHAPFRLSLKAHLVRATINNGNGGSPPIITDIKRLDKSSSFPLDPVRVLRDAEARFGRYLARNEPLIKKRLSGLRRLRLAESKKMRPRSASSDDFHENRPALRTTTERKYIWDQIRSQLCVLYIHKRKASWSNSYKVRVTSNCRPGVPCRAPRPYQWISQNLSYGIETALLLTYYKDGTLAKTQDHRDF